MNRTLKVGIGILIISIIIFGLGALTPQEEKPSEEKSEEIAEYPKVVSLPFSWEEPFKADTPAVRVTIVNLTYLGPGTLERIGLRGIRADEGYQFYGVYFTVKYLFHERSDTYARVGPLLELETDRGNIYQGKGFTLYLLSDFRPEEEKQGWDYFEIREDEKPTELLDYESIDGELRIAYIFKLD